MAAARWPRPGGHGNGNGNGNGDGNGGGNGNGDGERLGGSAPLGAELAAYLRGDDAAVGPAG